MTSSDEAAIVALFQAEDVAHRGQSDFTLEELRRQFLTKSTFDPARDIVLVEEDGRLIAAATFVVSFAIVVVTPGLADEPQLRADLLAWAEALQAEKGHRLYRTGIFAANAPGVAAIQAAGYELERTYTRMVRRFADTGPPEPVTLSPGYRLRRIDPDADAEVLYALNERAFAERADNTPESFQDWRHLIEFEQYAPDWSLLVATAEGQPAGSLVGWRPPDHPHGYVAVLAVDPAHRRHGLGRAMLLEAFAAIEAAGLPSAELHVASSDNAKALGLYTAVGMHGEERMENYTRTP